MQKILVVEDELKIARLVRDYLADTGFEVVMAHEGAGALAQFRQQRPDLVILDLGLPGMDGLDVARRLRQVSTTPIVMLTARGEETDTVLGLELGADDYLTKPFSPRELVARVRAVLRRSGGTAVEEVLTAGPLRIDVSRRRVDVADREAELTATEFDLLVTLARSPGRVFTRGQLTEALLGAPDPTYERTIDSHVKNLRRKVEHEPHRPRIVETVHGVGYRVADA